MSILQLSNTNDCEQEKTVADETNGTKTGQKRPEVHPKTSAQYWKTKVTFRPGLGNQLYYVRLREGERDVWVCTDKADKTKAATVAVGLWVRMKAIGLAALQKELAPDPMPTRAGTVGEAIAAASKLSTVRPISFLGYAKRLRQIACDIGNVTRPKVTTSWNSKEMEEWRNRVDAVRLDRLTADAVNAWKAGRVNAAGDDPTKRRTATITADSAIRLARAVFGENILAAGLGKIVALPDPLPFAGVLYGKSHKRFVSPVDPAKLFAAARSELETQHSQQFLAFSLCLLAGLRRSEADCLTWGQVDLERRSIRIHETDYFQPKSEDATREIELDDVAVEILRKAKSEDHHPTFVLKGAEFRRQESAAPLYRADAAPLRTWERLIAWLESQGVKDNKPIHVLRKLAGSLIFQAHGIEQARGFLGHGDVSTTSRSYVAKTKRVTVSLTGPTTTAPKAMDAPTGPKLKLRLKQPVTEVAA